MLADISVARIQLTAENHAKLVRLRSLAFLSICLITALLCGCASRLRVRPVVAGTVPNASKKGGVFYALPRTVVTATVVFNKTSFEGGAYCACAERALPEYPAQETGKACKEAKLGYKVDSIMLATRGEPDPTAVYEVDLSTRTFEDKTLNLQFTDDGVLTHGEAQSTNHTVEFVTATIGAAAKVAASALIPKARAACADVTLLEANKAATRIREMTQARDRILQGTSGTKDTLDVLQARVKPYNDQIKSDLENYFFGKTATSILWTGQFELLPTQDGTHTLFKYSPVDGICSDSLSTTATVLNPFNGTGAATTSGLSTNCANATTVTLSIKHSTDSPAGVVKPPGPMKDKTGFFYRIPATAFVSASETSPTRDEQGEPTTSTTVRYLAGMRAGVAQFGQTVWLPITTGGRRTQYTFDLLGTSGGMKTFTVASDAVLDKSVATDLASAASTVIEAEKVKAKAKADAEKKPSDLDALKEQGDILEQQKRILELQKEIDDLQKPPPTE